jgi:hypothetical protein
VATTFSSATTVASSSSKVTVAVPTLPTTMLAACALPLRASPLRACARCRDDQPGNNGNQRQLHAAFFVSGKQWTLV